ncbi:FAD:protein FMN transferase [Paenibacillus daejeonensis]|uniref:FAD:protein FMN transferase n=1 Tax=Paenibacillus daejeonensis TaxID=135193 RepID=UPI00036788C9|nr:FAD:protein FMN transferase [Paenibacillus daejeonensis]
MTIQRSQITMVLMLVVSLLVTGCGGAAKADDKPASRTYYLFSTIITVRVFDDRITEKHFDHIRGLLEEIDQQMNRQLAGSELDEVNRQAGGQSVVVSADTYKVVERALFYAEQSQGTFDPTVGPLVDLWAIGNGGIEVPRGDQIQAAVALINYEDVEMDATARTIRLKQPGMSLDLGAIAKGFAADLIAEYLTSEGIGSALIDLGGNLIALGAKPNGDAWSIGIQDPAEHRGAHLGTLQVVNKTVVTSGVYERFFRVGDTIYHHLLDPKSGYPFQNDLLSVTVITEESMAADALSTSVFGLGLDQGLAYLEQWKGVEAIFVTTDHVVTLTPGLIGKFHLSHDGYRFAE